MNIFALYELPEYVGAAVVVVAAFRHVNGDVGAGLPAGELAGCLLEFAGFGDQADACPDPNEAQLPTCRLLRDWQAVRCSVCGGPSEFDDHDHESGPVRGELCRSCNTLQAFADLPGNAFERYRAKNPATVLGIKVRHFSPFTEWAQPQAPSFQPAWTARGTLEHMYDKRPASDPIAVARLHRAAMRHARWHEPAAEETAAAAAELEEIADRRDNFRALRAEVAGILIGARTGQIDELRARAAAHFCIEAGAHPELAPRWIEEGNRRAGQAALPPFGAKVL